MSFPDSNISHKTQKKFRIIYVENSSNILSHKSLFTGMYSTLEEIKERIAYFIPHHPSIKIEYYNKKLGYCNRKMLSDALEPDQESIYVYLRSTIPMSCNVCGGCNKDGVDTDTNIHEHH